MHLHYSEIHTVKYFWLQEYELGDTKYVPNRKREVFIKIKTTKFCFVETMHTILKREKFVLVHTSNHNTWEVEARG